VNDSDLAFLAGLTDEEYDAYWNYKLDCAEIAEHIAACGKSMRDEYCKICNEY
jgi:hypothetical protein